MAIPFFVFFKNGKNFKSGKRIAGLEIAVLATSSQSKLIKRVCVIYDIYLNYRIFNRELFHRITRFFNYPTRERLLHLFIDLFMSVICKNVYKIDWKINTSKDYLCNGGFDFSASTW